MAEFTKIRDLVLLLIVLIILMMFYYNPNGAFNKIKESTSSLKDVVKVGVDQTPGAKPTIPSSHEKVINQLKDTIKKMHSAKEPYCFARYNDRLGGSGFPDLGEKGTSIILSAGKNKQGKEGMQIQVLGGIGGSNEVSYEFIEGVSPCVIAGEYKDARGTKVNVVENFYNAYIQYPDVDSQTKKENMLRDYAYHYRPVQTLTITYVSNIADSNGNSIRSAELGADGIDDEGNNLLDGGLIYTPDNKHICFFPTSSGTGDATCSGDDLDGLDDDCLGDDQPPLEAGNLIRQFTQQEMRHLDNGYLTTCSSS